MCSIRQAPRHLQGYYWNVLEDTGLQLMHTSSNDIRRGNIGTHHPCKEQASCCTSTNGKKYVKRNRKTNIWIIEPTKVTDVIEQVRRPKWSWAGYVSRIRDNRWASRIMTWKPYEGKRSRGRSARRWRDELDDYWKGTIWQRIAQDRHTWKQHTEAFAQPRDTTAAQ